MTVYAVGYLIALLLAIGGLFVPTRPLVACSAAITAGTLLIQNLVK